MKPLYTIGLIIAFLACSFQVFSQNNPNLQRRTTPQRTPETTPDKTSTLTERARIKNEEVSKAPAHIVWLREMYRYIYLEEADNAALYFPVQPIGNRMNLFTTIFKLLADKKITAYNFRFDGREVFTDAEKLNFEEGFLKKFKIPYKKQGTGDNVKYIVDDINIPSSEVLIYQIKEGHYFDAATGTYKSQVTAILPIWVRKDYDVGDETLNPLFWIPYENLRPYLLRTLIMTSDYNNVMTYSVDDFFTKGMYRGKIVKTVNLRDQSLAEQVGDDPEKLKLAQDSIENQLKAFRQQLWIQPDTTQVAAVKSSKKESAVKGSTPTAKKEKEEKPKAGKPEKSLKPASPTKSVRRTR